MERVLVREQPMMWLRVVLGPTAGGSAVPSFATVAWAGRVGHPSSYALLTGTRSEVPGVTLFDTGGRHRDPLVRRLDKVRWGLLPEYEQAVAAVLRSEPQPVLVTHAAHAEIGSSQVAFEGVTRLLCRILAGGLPDDDDEVWRLRDRCWQRG